MRHCRAARPDPPLCPLRGHLPLQGGEGKSGRRFGVTSNVMPSSGRKKHFRFQFEAWPLAPLSPLEGEMPAQAGRGGAAARATAIDVCSSSPERAMPLRKLPKRTRSNAKTLRSNMTEAEKRLWQVLRAHRLEGIAFRRQMPICRLHRRFCGASAPARCRTRRFPAW